VIYLKIVYYIDKLEEAKKNDSNVEKFCDKYANKGIKEFVSDMCMWDVDVDEDDEFIAAYINEYC